MGPVGRVSVRLELAIALVITPLVITIIWFWSVDNFLMSIETKHQQKGAKRRMTAGAQFTEAMNERLVDSDMSGDEQVEMTIGIGTLPVHATCTRRVVFPLLMSRLFVGGAAWCSPRVFRPRRTQACPLTSPHWCCLPTAGWFWGGGLQCVQL